jgi:hypothetical protein
LILARQNQKRLPADQPPNGYFWFIKNQKAVTQTLCF